MRRVTAVRFPLYSPSMRSVWFASLGFRARPRIGRFCDDWTFGEARRGHGCRSDADGAVAPAASAADKGTPTADDDDAVSAPASDGEGIEDLDVPEDYVEVLPPGVVAPNPSSESRQTRTVGVGTDGHYCNSFYIKHISYTFGSTGGYTRIHVQVTQRYLYLGSWTGVLASAAWNAVKNCIRSGGPHGVWVRSWAAVEDQFLCHVAAAASNRWIAHQIGTSWDLEGHRHPTNNPCTWATTRCNW